MVSKSDHEPEAQTANTTGIAACVATTMI